jgi:hypothetical protein
LCDFAIVIGVLKKPGPGFGTKNPGSKIRDFGILPYKQGTDFPALKIVNPAGKTALKMANPALKND